MADTKTHLRSLAERLGKLFHERLARSPDSADPASTGHLVRHLIEDALRERASDIHLDSIAEGLCIRFRIDGAMSDVANLSRSAGEHLLRYFKVNAGLNPGPSFVPEDSHLQMQVDGRTVDLRLACAPCSMGEKLTLRILQQSRVRISLGELGLFEEDRNSIEQWLAESAGMFVVAGPVGSGKTTTLYAILNEMHMLRKSITTIEDPVEYKIDKINQIQVDPKHGLTFERGLRSILRLDPDLILLGEIRDAESASVAIEASNTGRVLLSTMHSRDAAGVVTSLRNLGAKNHEISAALAFVVAQRLVRKLCSHCRTREKPTDEEVAWLGRVGENAPRTAWRAVGCDACHGTGYSGRTGVFEVWRFDEASYEMVRNGIDEHGLRHHLGTIGTRSLLVNGLKKAAEGMTDLAELRTMGGLAYQPRKIASQTETGAGAL